MGDPEAPRIHVVQQAPGNVARAGDSLGLLRQAEAQYGEPYRAHVLEQYKIYVEMADRVSQRRQSANAYFLSANTLLVAIAGLLSSNLMPKAIDGWRALIPFAGLLVCVTWGALVRSYKQLNSGKFKVIHAIEQLLPLAPYDAEWAALGRGKDRSLYWPFSHVEQGVPWIFGMLYVVLLLFMFHLPALMMPPGGSSKGATVPSIVRSGLPRVPAHHAQAGVAHGRAADGGVTRMPRLPSATPTSTKGQSASGSM